MAPDGSNLINLTNNPAGDFRPPWSPDGSQIAWLSGDDGNWNVFVMSVDGSNRIQITDNGQVFGVQWTVDGRIFTSWGWAGQEEFCHNCVVDANGANITDLDLFTGDYEIYLIGAMYPDTFLNLTNNLAQDRNPDWPSQCDQ